MRLFKPDIFCNSVYFVSIGVNLLINNVLLIHKLENWFVTAFFDFVTEEVLNFWVQNFCI